MWRFTLRGLSRPVRKSFKQADDDTEYELQETPKKKKIQFWGSSSEDILGDDEISHEQKEGITVNYAQIAIIPTAWPPIQVLRDKW